MFQASKGLCSHFCCNTSPWKKLWEQTKFFVGLKFKLFELAQTRDSPAMNWNYRDEEAGGTLARMARSQWWAAESLEC